MKWELSPTPEEISEELAEAIRLNKEEDIRALLYHVDSARILLTKCLMDAFHLGQTEVALHLLKALDPWGGVDLDDIAYHDGSDVPAQEAQP